ncbi:MAG: peptide deformylase [Bacteroidia bacterium]|nr:peptide deformylase [Bacteroidia bacterium]MDW8158295.1 peptide deformylase [Bacteroidia bacterium]
MVLPIYAYGQNILRQKAKPITSDYPQLEQLIQSMFETMYNAHGVGLAAPQVGLSIRLFVMDSTPLEKKEKEKNSNIKDLNSGEHLGEGAVAPPVGLKAVFINAEKILEEGEPFKYKEGCLSIPDVDCEITRPSKIVLKYYDENFNEKTEEFSGIRARIIQHEYDHLEGILLTDYLPTLQRHMMASKLQRILKGNIEVDYPIIFAKAKKKVY